MEVIEVLKKYGISGDFKKGTLAQFEKIITTLDEMIQSQKDGIDKIKANKPSLSKISSLTGISRQTFYNNPVLTEFAEKYIAENAVDDPNETISKLKSQIRDKDSIIEKMVARDGKIAELMAKVYELEQENVSLKKTIESQEITISKAKEIEKRKASMS